MLPVVLFEETSPHDPMLTDSFDRLREGDALSVFVMFSTPDADELLTHARAHPEATLYILDIDLPAVARDQQPESLGIRRVHIGALTLRAGMPARARIRFSREAFYL